MSPHSTHTEERPPVVTVLGHIDHGKSTLLDYIRKANVTAKEAGGITQHLGAYEVSIDTPGGVSKKITFLDTPGHEAFRAIRSRGVRAADIAILVVAADDGVKAQTLEALKAIIDGGIPYLVAVNKIDKEGSQVERVLNQLAEHGVFLEGRGGQVPYAMVSAKAGTGIKELLELILLVAEVAELRGTEHRPASGVVIESHVHKTKGVTGTLLIKDGTLCTGMVVAAGDALAPVRYMEDFTGARVSSATMSSPVQIVGWDTLPDVGSPFASFENKKGAQAYITSLKNSPSRPLRQTQGTSDNEGTERSIPIVVKADTKGSIDAVVYEIEKLAATLPPIVRVRIVYTGVGDISESDIKSAGNGEHALVVGFHVGKDARAQEIVDRQGIPLETFTIIYELIEWLEKEIRLRVPKQTIEEVRGRLKILKVFGASGRKQVVGGRVTEGILSHKDVVRIVRRDAILGNGTVIEIQKNKSEASSVQEGDECGLKIDSKIDIAGGDVLEAFVLIER